jgi:cytochrome c biogenesis protein CcdA
MTALLLVLTPISLLDSTSMLPLAVVPLSIALTARRPLLVAGGFLSGIFVVYVAGGLLFLVGVGALLETLSEKLERWYHQPNTLELVLQIIVGLVMLGFFWKLANAREGRPDKTVSEDVTPWQAFVFGAGLTLVGLPGAFPYIGAVDQVLKADLGATRSALAVIFYSVVFLVPLTTLLILRLVLRERSAPIFAWVVSFTERWGRRLILIVLVVVGAALVADGIGWFYGKPLLPV